MSAMTRVIATRRTDPTGSYYDRIIERAIAEGRSNHRRPIPPLDGDSATPRFWAHWRRATRNDRPRVAPDPEDLAEG